MSKIRTDWTKYKIDNKIQEIMSSNKRLQNFMNWVKKYKLLAIKAIKFNDLPYNQLDNLQNTLHQLYNSAQN